jgi:hypothetical protein
MSAAIDRFDELAREGDATVSTVIAGLTLIGYS